MSEYPEHDRLKLISDKSQTIGAFLEWLNSESGLEICTLIEGQIDDRFAPAGISIEKLLAQYFEIDLDKIEKEKRAMLDSIRAAN